MSEWKITKEGLQNSAGFTVQFVDRSTTRYIEGKRTLTVELEYTSKDIVYVYLKNVVHWDAPSTSDIITPEEKLRIRQNLGEAFLFEELKAKFDD
jgi:hypothetical protein